MAADTGCIALPGLYGRLRPLAYCQTFIRFRMSSLDKYSNTRLHFVLASDELRGVLLLSGLGCYRVIGYQLVKRGEGRESPHFKRY